MIRLVLGGLAFAAVATAALGLRLPGLDKRPMHGDEAIQAVHAGELWERGYSKYDPEGYHGPTLHYLTLPFLWISPAERFAETTEATFRRVPALFGAGVAVLAWALSDGLGFGAMTMAAVLLAVSPSLVFYSRYYVQEMLLVFFLLSAVAAGFRFARSGKRGWLYWAAVYAGLMFATKETAVVAAAAMAGALSLAARRDPRLSVRALAGPALAAAAVAAVCISSFLTNPAGMLDALRAPGYYSGLAWRGGDHAHPWHYYLGLLAYSRPQAGGPWWSEGLIVALAGAGMVAAWTGRGVPAAGIPLARFLSWTALLMAAIYSIIPYKTPWCMLGFSSCLAILAGAGAAALLRWLSSRWARVLLTLALGAGVAHLAWQAYLASFVYPADRRNPYAYAHPVEDVRRLGRRVERLAELHPDGREMLVRVIADNPWPLPWYLRRLDRVGYWRSPPEDVSAPVVIADMDAYGRFSRRLETTHHAAYYGLRPPVVLAACFENGLWKRFLEEREGEGPGAGE